MRVYCVLCGSVVETETSDTWMGEFRALYTETNKYDQVRISGVGTLDTNQTTVPADPNRRYDDRSPDRGAIIDVKLCVSQHHHAERMSPRENNIAFWGFGFHAACWDLLTTVRQPSFGDLFYTCLSMPVSSFGLLDWGHSYGGAAIRLTDGFSTFHTHLESRMLQEPVSSGIRFDPMNIPGLCRLLETLAPPSRQERAHLTMPRNSRTRLASSDLFNSLPAEILCKIIIDLRSQDVHALRLASRACANVWLPEAFWASRFLEDGEYHHIFEAQHINFKSWEQLHFTVRMVSQICPNLKNRKRIWELATRLHDQLADMPHVPCMGRPLHGYFERADERDKLPWLTASRGLRGPGEPFQDGCRALRSRKVHIQTRSRVTKVFVSFCRLLGGDFICGLRFEQEYGQNTSLGYIRADREVPITFPASQPRESAFTISEFQLALHLEGVKAISVLTDDGASSSWVGDHEGIPKWCLADVRGIISALKGEFDAFKLLSLSISTHAMSRGDTVGDFPFRNICNWSHSVPPKHFLFSRADYEDESIMYMESCKHLSAITFGGSDGQDLSKLVEIAMCSFGVGSVTGFEFVYNDSSRRSFGRLEPLPLGFNLQQIPSEPERVVLSIDGPGGERIDNIQIQRGVAVKVNRCRMRTNRGKVVLFPPPPSTHADSWEPIESPGRVITGFYGTEVSFLAFKI
ncbi:hypothetical protein BKA56DRAFT_482558 [Ilyonectria sp. MPI-CAGE-AT-0026]|nr:hypothetical protein BKA56DRAFT_482558 [Ilyonectria sp. MPI-CAGE-AT-0026]